MGNDNLRTASKRKNDEFYTLLPDIEKELQYYKDQFKDKVVFCNCDDPIESNFIKFFAQQFNNYKLKRLIGTHYSHSDLFTEANNHGAHKIVCEDRDKDGKIDFGTEVEFTKLNGDGSFDSDEAIELLKEADIVVTNPPFSKFRDYVELLMAYDKKFLIIGNDNARTYKNIFKLFMSNKIWHGHNHVKEFKRVDQTISKMGNVSWFTNLTVNKRNEELILTKTYKGNEENYPKYDNYDAIEVSKVSDIPYDYKGVMGVPITFLEKYNPKQFKVLGDSRYHDGMDEANDINVVGGSQLYRRILIRNLKF